MNDVLSGLNRFNLYGGADDAGNILKVQNGFYNFEQELKGNDQITFYVPCDNKRNNRVTIYKYNSDKSSSLFSQTITPGYSEIYNVYLDKTKGRLKNGDTLRGSGFVTSIADEKVTISHTESANVVPGSYGASEGSFSRTLNIPKIRVNAQGHIIEITESTITLGGEQLSVNNYTVDLSDLDDNDPSLSIGLGASNYEILGIVGFNQYSVSSTGKASPFHPSYYPSSMYINETKKGINVVFHTKPSVSSGYSAYLDIYYLRKKIS